MEYGQNIGDNNYLKHVGYSNSPTEYFNKDTIRVISCKITELLYGVDPQNRPIIVPDSTITGVMSEVYNSYRPKTGDIYSRFIINSGERQYLQNMIDQTIEIIVTDVKNNLGMEECNKRLTVWSSLLGDFNQQGLRSHPPIKIRKNRLPTQFNMNY